MIVDEKGIKDSWKYYMEKLMNEENEWDHRILAGVKEGPADCIRINEVAAGLSGLGAEMRHITGDIGTQWILDLCNGIMKNVCIPEDWSQVWYYQVTKGKGIQWSVDPTEELNCWNML